VREASAEGSKAPSGGLSGLGLFAGMDMPVAGTKAQTEASFEADKAYASTAGSARD